MGCTTSEPIKEESEIKTVNIVKRKEDSKEKIQNVKSKYNSHYNDVITINKFPKYGIRSLVSDINYI